MSTLIYVLRRDLRLADNPILHSLSTKKDHGFTHLLPLYVFPAQQVEVSGFISEEGKKSPYPEARSEVGGFWRCGPRRVKFLSESVWDLKISLEEVDSGLCIRVGMLGEVVKQLLESSELKVGGVWMTEEEGVEEKREEKDVRRACGENGTDFQLRVDEKYFIDDRDVPFSSPSKYPDIFTNYRKSVEPLREAPRSVLAKPKKGSLPTFPKSIPAQHSPFTIPSGFDGLLKALQDPLTKDEMIKNPPQPVPDTKSAHPFTGGENEGQKRVSHLISSGSVTSYQDTRNGLLGTDYSTKFSAWLALGCITARQVHSQLLDFEDGKNSCPESWKSADGFGKGENRGTKGIRFELLWRDYMRLCTRKFGPKLFQIQGFKNSPAPKDRWLSLKDPRAASIIERFLNGTTGMGFIDASQRELYHTGYTSNRSRQNVASFLSKMLNIDWRIGAEYYECMLVDYDLSSNWGNWQYVAGVGNDPRGENGRVFNPVKQAFDYDPQGDYVKAWVQELRTLDSQSEIFQAWTISEDQREKSKLAGLEMVESPLKKIDFTIGRRGKSDRGHGNGHSGKDRGSGRGRYRNHNDGGHSNSVGEKGMGPASRYGGRGYGSTRGYATRGFRGGKQGRTGMMEKDAMNVQNMQAGYGMVAGAGMGQSS